MYRRNVGGQLVYAQLNSREDGSPLTSGVTCKHAGASYADSANSPTHLGGGFWELELSQAETDFEKFGVQFNHSTGVNVGYTLSTTDAISEAVLLRDWAAMLAGSPAPTVPDRCLLNAARVLRNAWAISAGVWTITQEDDTTAAFSKPVTGTPGADPVTEVGADE